MATIEQVARLGAIVRNARKSKDMTLEDLSKALGERWKPAYLSNIETGNMYPKREDYNIPDPLVKGLATALDVPLSDLHDALGRIPKLERIAVSPGTASIHHKIEQLADNPEALRILDAAMQTFLREQGLTQDEDDGDSEGNAQE